MILKEFAKELKKYAAEVPPSIILTRWLKDILVRKPETNTEKIIHAELTLLEDNENNYAIVGTRLSGQKLLETLYRYIQSLENQDYSRWLHHLQANDFEEDE